MPEPFLEKFLETHSGEVMFLVLFLLVVGTLVILVPQLLRAHLRRSEMLHQEQMKALEQGHAPAPPDESTRAAGRTAMLVPMVVVIAAGTVTCFLAAYRSDNLFTVAITAWSVAGVVSLAAITGGVALLGRLAQLRSGVDEEEPADAFRDHPGNR
jgi:hypothetical protein